MPRCEYGESCRRRNLTHFYTDSHPENVSNDRFWQGITGVYENIMLDSVFKVHGCSPVRAFMFTYQADSEFLKKIFKSLDEEMVVDIILDGKVNDSKSLEVSLKPFCKDINVHSVKPIQYSSHHPKLFLLECEEFWYIAVSTANLVWYHWGQADHIPYTNLTWISPRLSKSDKNISSSSKTDLSKFLSVYDLKVTKTLAQKLNTIDFSHLADSVQFIHNSPVSFSWNSESFKSSFSSSTSSNKDDHILIIAVSSVQTFSQTFINKLLYTTKSSQIILQWPTEKYVENFGLEKNSVHCFTKKVSIDKLLANKQLYHFSLSNKLPHLKVYRETI